jgi:hypothetical protein
MKLKYISCKMPFKKQKFLLLLAAGITSIIVFYPFTTAFHQNADDNLYHYIALSGSTKAMVELTNKEATLQGRIGKYISAPIKFYVNLNIDRPLVRILVIAIFFASFSATYRYIGLILNLRIASLAAIVSLATIPMTAYHMPPNNYPLAFSLPFLLLVLLRSCLLKLQWSFIPNRKYHIGARVVSIPLILNNEYTIILFAFMILLESTFRTRGAGNHSLGDEKQHTFTLSPKRRLNRLFKSPEVILDFIIFFIVCLIYIGFRWSFPSTYEGNLVAQNIEFVSIINTQWHHIINGISFAHFSSEMLEWYARHKLAVFALFLAASYVSYNSLLVVEKRHAFYLIFLGSVWAVLVTLPVALSSKYQEWCNVHGYCAHFDSRIASYGLFIALTGIVLLAFMLLLNMIGKEVFSKAIVACLVGIIASLTASNNYVSAKVMGQIEEPFRSLHAFVCATKDTKKNGVTTSSKIASIPGIDIAWHPDGISSFSEIYGLPLTGEGGKAKYIEMYIEHLRSRNGRCEISEIPTNTVLNVGKQEVPGIHFFGWDFLEEGGRWPVGHSSAILINSDWKNLKPKDVVFRFKSDSEEKQSVANVILSNDIKTICSLEITAETRYLALSFEKINEKSKPILLIFDKAGVFLSNGRSGDADSNSKDIVIESMEFTTGELQDLDGKIDCG